jgi:MFS family permease
VGAVYVLLHSRPADGLLGHAHPAIRDILSVSTAEMGIVLFGLSIGSMSGILCSAWLVKRFGTRAVIRTTMCFAVFGMGAERGAVVCLAGAVRPRADGIWRQLRFGGSGHKRGRGSGRTRDEQNRAADDARLYSLGTLAGAGVGMALTATGVSANLHILLAALVCIIPI